MLVLLALLAAADPSVSSPAAPPPDLSAAPVVQQLAAPDGTQGLRATFVVQAPPDVVLDTLWDVRRFRQIFPDIEALEVVAAGPGFFDARFTVDAVLAKVHYTLHREIDRSARSVRWQSIAGDLKDVRGGWQVSPTADPMVSTVTYTSFVDIGYAVPTGMVRDTALKKVDHMAERVRAACRTAVLASR
ncbi:MAG: SRPBCC family protein [Deltaproteobacteria bacterium]|nr:SRPBCC family protein [Deltaproteobacteria bacterium]